MNKTTPFQTTPFIFDYNRDDICYSRHRRPDPRIASIIHAALGSARTVVNIGAGTGSYEPEDRYVLAIEPSIAMRAQRGAHLAPAIIATAESIPLDDKTVDASMAMVTTHHWSDPEKGLLEMKRVTRHRILILTFDPDALDSFWNIDYFPNVVATERRRYLSIDRIISLLDAPTEIQSIPIPLDCTDGFQEAFFGRPEAFLDPAVRRAQSAWGFFDDAQQEAELRQLRADLATGEWDRRHGKLRTQPIFVGAMRLIVVSL